jgi:hypothetical protein
MAAFFLAVGTCALDVPFPFHYFSFGLGNVEAGIRNVIINNGLIVGLEQEQSGCQYIGVSMSSSETLTVEADT